MLQRPIESLLGDDGALDAPAAEEPEESGEEPVEASGDEAQAGQGSDDEAAEAEPEQVTLETIDDVAQALGVDPSDLLATLKFARVWGSSAFDGQTVQRDHVLADGDVVEIHA